MDEIIDSRNSRPLCWSMEMGSAARKGMEWWGAPVVQRGESEPISGLIAKALTLPPSAPSKLPTSLTAYMNRPLGCKAIHPGRGVSVIPAAFRLPQFSVLASSVRASNRH